MRSPDYPMLINSIEERIVSGEAILREEAESLLETPDEHLLRLLAAADRIRIKFKGNGFDSCTLINARSGLCAEDCAFCAQSSHHHADCSKYGLVSEDKILAAARSAHSSGASRFCTVTSGGALSAQEFDSVIDYVSKIASEVDIALDASLGFLDEARADRLRAAGVTRYNHNLETSPDYYASICTTHTFDQRVATVQKAMHAGMSACCGGIIGMGETPRQRLGLAFTLAELGVDCVPINILNPRPGTRLEHAVPPEPLEILKTVALFRLVLPRATIKIAGGREQNLREFQAMALRSGANGMIIGGYLTYGGRSVEQDLRMVREAGYVMSAPN